MLIWALHGKKFKASRPNLLLIISTKKRVQFSRMVFWSLLIINSETHGTTPWPHKNRKLYLARIPLEIETLLTHLSCQPIQQAAFRENQEWIQCHPKCGKRHYRYGGLRGGKERLIISSFTVVSSSLVRVAWERQVLHTEGQWYSCFWPHSVNDRFDKWTVLERAVN